MRLSAALFSLAFLLATIAGYGQTVQNLTTRSFDDPSFVTWYSVPNVKHAPLTSAAGTGSAYSNTSLSDTTVTPTLSNTNQPTEPRELVIYQSDDDDGTTNSLSVTYTINVTNWDGSKNAYTLTLANTDSYQFKTAVTKVNSISAVITGSGASDAIKIGYRGFYVPGAVLDSNATILIENINGTAASTAGSITNGFYKPNSIAATNSLGVMIRSGVQAVPFFTRPVAQTETITIH